jgi:hypothetical protein
VGGIGVGVGAAVLTHQSKKLNNTSQAGQLFSGALSNFDPLMRRIPMKIKRNTILFCLTILLVFTTVRCLPIQGAIHGYVWDDKDKNGIIDDGEDMIGGVAVQLLDGSGEILKAETTDYSGYYVFRQLNSGANRIYEIKVFAPPGQAFTKQGPRDNTKASHVDQSGFSREITVDDVHDINAGLVEPPPEPDSAPPASASPEPTEDTQNGIDILKLLGSSAHGNDLYKENLIIFLKTEVLELEPD